MTQLARSHRLYTPAEAELLTGVTVNSQRSWRTRGYLPPSEGTGWTRFTVMGLIELYLINEASSGGASLVEAQEIAHKALRDAVACFLNLIEPEMNHPKLVHNLHGAARRRSGPWSSFSVQDYAALAQVESELGFRPKVVLVLDITALMTELSGALLKEEAGSRQ